MIGNGLIFHELHEEGEGEDGLFEIVEKFFDEIGNQMWIGNGLQVFIVSLAEFVISLLLFVEGYAFPEDSQGGKTFGLALKVEDKHFEDNWNSQLANFVIFQLIDFLGYQSLDSLLKLMLLPLLFLRHLLSQQVYSIIP